MSDCFNGPSVLLLPNIFSGLLLSNASSESEFVISLSLVSRIGNKKLGDCGSANVRIGDSEDAVVANLSTISATHWGDEERCVSPEGTGRTCSPSDRLRGA